MGAKTPEPGGARLTVYRFADLTLDSTRRSVKRGDSDLRLARLSYELLLLLVEAAPRVVTQQEVAKRLWGDRIATEDTLRQRIKLLRKALGDDADNPRYFSVVRGQGYRLIPEVESVASNVAPSRGGSRLLQAVLLGMAVIVMPLAYWFLTEDKSIPESSDVIATSAPPAQSIAILPFENLTDDPGDTYFVEGFHNDLLTQMSKLGGFKVISRTSVLEYRDSRKNLKKIGVELNVAAILEGSVQRSGDTVRINAQLIDAINDEHLWAERYDRDLTAQNLFDIQSQMAAAIARALHSVLPPDELARIKKIPTENTKAYNHYLLGKYHTTRVNNLLAFPDAAKAFELAVEADPEFAVAWAQLSRAYSAIYFFVNHDPSTLELAGMAVERAFELQPDLPEAHLAKGYYFYLGVGDYEAALREWEIAERGLPGDSQIFQARAYLFSRMGDLENAMLNMDRAIELDPRNVDNLHFQAIAHARLHDYDQAEKIYDDMIQMVPYHPLAYLVKAGIALWRDGDGATANAMLESAPVPMPTNDITWLPAIYERNFDSALSHLDSWQVDALDIQNIYRPKDWFFGMTHKLAGDPDAANEYFRAARYALERLHEERPMDVRLVLALADTMAQLDERQIAVDLAHRAMEMVPVSKDAAAAGNARYHIIWVFVAAADFDTALAEIDTYLANPAVWSIEGLLPDPRLDPIRDDPRFEQLVRKYRRK